MRQVSLDEEIDRDDDLNDEPPVDTISDEFTGHGFDIAPSIQAIRSAADRYVDILRELSVIQERKRKTEHEILARMREGRREIITHKGKTFIAQDHVRLQVKPAINEKK